ncbi:MAG: hypothetical protein HP497_10750 [Nitrospira sp.]|nr:hypothetical protein [Nitrospira sp.]
MMMCIEELRQLIAIRLDARVLRWFKSLAAKRRVPYQSHMNELLAGENEKSGVGGVGIHHVRPAL